MAISWGQMPVSLMTRHPCDWQVPCTQWVYIDWINTTIPRSRHRMCPAPWKDLLGPLALNTTSPDDPASAPSLQVLPICDWGVNESHPVYTMGVTVGPPGSRHWHRSKIVEGLLGLTVGETVVEGAGKHSGQNVDLTPSLRILLP